MSTVVLVSDQVYLKTLRHIEKVRACAPQSRIILAIAAGYVPQDFPRLARDLNVRVEVGDIAHLAQVLAAESGHLPKIVALNQSAILPALALRRALGLPMRSGVFAACDKRVMRERLFEYGGGLELAYREVLPGASDTTVQPFCADRYVVKPAFGMSSADVRMYESWQDALAYARRPISSKSWVPNHVLAALDKAGLRTDARLIEPYIPGTEFSVDGWITGDRFWAIVQHKLHMNEQRTFIGDGTTVSPPISDTDRLPLGCHALLSSEARISRFAHEVLRAIGYSEGVFHMEAREQPDGLLRVIEVNPRAPGGSLWRSVYLRTGYDLELVDAAIQLGLDIPAPEPARACHVLHHPFYAPHPGMLQHWGGLASFRDAGELRFVDDAVKLGHEFEATDLNEEPYLAFAVAGAQTLDALLEVRQRILGLPPPLISSTPAKIIVQQGDEPA